MWQGQLEGERRGEQGEVEQAVIRTCSDSVQMRIILNLECELLVQSCANKYSTTRTVASSVWDMLHPLNSNALLRIAHSRQSTLLPLRASISFAHYRHAHNIFRHTSPPSRQLYNHPAAHNPRDQQASSPPPISTVNDAEIAHFSRLSALWWDERGEFGLLHKMNPHRVRFIREKVLEVQRDEQPYSGLGAATATSPLESSRVLEGMDVLDVGCGGGILSEVRLFPRFPPPTSRTKSPLHSSPSPTRPGRGAFFGLIY